MNENTSGYSKEKNIGLISNLALFAEYMGVITQHGTDLPITDFEYDNFTQAHLDMKKRGENDPRINTMIRHMFDSVNFIQGTKPGEIYVDMPSLDNVKMVLYLLRVLVESSEIEMFGNYAFMRNELTQELEKAMDVFRELYNSDEDSYDYQFIVWLLLSLDLQVLDTGDNYLIIGKFGTELPKPELKKD